MVGFSVRNFSQFWRRMGGRLGTFFRISSGSSMNSKVYFGART